MHTTPPHPTNPPNPPSVSEAQRGAGGGAVWAGLGGCGRGQTQVQGGVLRPQLPQELDQGPVRGAVTGPPAQHAQGQRQALQPGEDHARLEHQENRLDRTTPAWNTRRTH